MCVFHQINFHLFSLFFFSVQCWNRVLGIQPVVWVGVVEEQVNLPYKLTPIMAGWKQRLTSVAKQPPKMRLGGHGLLLVIWRPTKKTVRTRLLWISKSDRERVAAIAAVVC